MPTARRSSETQPHKHLAPRLVAKIVDTYIPHTHIHQHPTKSPTSYHHLILLAMVHSYIACSLLLLSWSDRSISKYTRDIPTALSMAGVDLASQFIINPSTRSFSELLQRHLSNYIMDRSNPGRRYLPRLLDTEKKLYLDIIEQLKGKMRTLFILSTRRGLHMMERNVCKGTGHCNIKRDRMLCLHYRAGYTHLCFRICFGSNHLLRGTRTHLLFTIPFRQFN